MKGGSENLENLSLKELRKIIRELLPGEEDRVKKIIIRIDLQRGGSKKRKAIGIINELQAEASREMLQKKINVFLGGVGIGSPGAEGAKSERTFDPTPLIEFAHTRGLHDRPAEEIYGAFVEYQTEEIERAVAGGGAGGGAAGRAAGRAEPASYSVGDTVLYEGRDGSGIEVSIVAVNTNVDVGEDPDISIRMPDGTVRETTIMRLKPVAEMDAAYLQGLRDKELAGGSDAEIDAAYKEGLKDKEMPIGSRVWVPEFSPVLAGDYKGFTQNSWGANVHHIDFEHYGKRGVNLRDRKPTDWKVVWVPYQGPRDRQVYVDQGGIAAGGSPGPLQSVVEGSEGTTVTLPALRRGEDLSYALYEAGIISQSFGEGPGSTDERRLHPDTRPVVTEMGPGPFLDAGMVIPSLLLKLNEHDYTRDIYEDGLRVERLDKEKAKVINITFKNISGDKRV